MRNHTKLISVTAVLLIVYVVFLLPGCNTAVYPSYYGGGYFQPLHKLTNANRTSFYYSRDVRSGSVGGSRQLGGGPRSGK